MNGNMSGTHSIACQILTHHFTRSMSAFSSALRIPRSALWLFVLLALVSCLLSPGHTQDDPFAAGVRATPWLSPADEQKLFKLPPGFDIQLVAAEPEIQK